MIKNGQTIVFWGRRIWISVFWIERSLTDIIRQREPNKFNHDSRHILKFNFFT